MHLKSVIIKPIAKWIHHSNKMKHEKAIECQLEILKNVVNDSIETRFGRDHNFYEIFNYEDFKRMVPVRDYEGLKPYFDKIINGEENVCWKGRPIYFAKTSGTTSGSKYIPITKDSINHHIVAARNALFAYVDEKDSSDFFSGKMIFLQGSPMLTDTNGIKIGRLSGIVYHHVPNWLVSNRKPSFETNCISDWEEKVDKVVEETYQEDMHLISGIPPWCIMYFEKLIKKTGKQTIQEIFPNFKLFVYGGLNFEPYREKIQKLIGFDIDTIETYPASEGFFAYQDSQKEDGLLLNTSAGIFYEFIKVEDAFLENPKRIGLDAIGLHVNYVLIVTTNAGLWAYNTGDTIKFVSKRPFRIKVTGRLKHFLSAFGEHVIAEEVEFAIAKVSNDMKLNIHEFTVAPFIATSSKDASYHEWFIETDVQNSNLRLLSEKIDLVIQEKNAYYKDLREGNILNMPRIRIVKKNGFADYQKTNGKFGGQNKVVHLSNDRNIASNLSEFVKKDK